MQPETNSTPLASNGDCNGCAVGLSKAETEVYDRQIRLWGLEAQKKLHVASALVCGLCGVGAEITKNLMLCGLRSLTLMDDKLVSRSDLDSNFLLNEDFDWQESGKSVIGQGSIS
ncbi:E1 ubiquitin-activating protein aos1 [Parelaphostrongylus tenuis]|uniref:E1 ubiquitin-activating protein aos1 n=1 Tax=Parelaphostrongylus tenuis TaxID=148309 RepID=A0AAD5R1K6_PARTN|nr:E1 ubiquitin-activating protein aos1 [Parelaphostrongylus tenuis]